MNRRGREREADPNHINSTFKISIYRGNSQQ